MLSNVLLGQFINTKSVIHKIDPRVKLLFNFVFFILTFSSGSYFSFIALFLIIFTVILISKTPIKMYLKGLRSIVFFVLITFFINIFFLEGTVIFKFGFLKITEEGLNTSIFAGLKMILLLLASSLLLFVTPISDLNLAIEKILSPLKFFKVNTRDFTTIITIALRFIPILFEETNKIMVAQKARGANYTTGSLVKRAKNLSNILMPLFVSAFKRADDLSVAMECRCYSYNCQKTNMKNLKLKSIDILSIFVIIIISIIVPCCNVNIY